MKRPILLTAFIFGSVSCFLKADAPGVNEETVVLPAFSVSAQVVDSFGVGISFEGNTGTKKMMRAMISSVAPNSDADFAGLNVGDEITSIGGKPITDYSIDLSKGSELFKILVNRKPGTKLKLSVVIKKTKQVTLSAMPYNPLGLP